MTDAALNKALAKWAGKDGQAIYPDYCNDLNAMATLEAKLSDETYPKFQYAVHKTRNDVCGLRCRCLSATARQRAEALAKTVGVWRDSP